MDRNIYTMDSFIKTESKRWCPFGNCMGACSFTNKEEGKAACSIENVLRVEHKTPLKYYNNDFIYAMGKER